MIAPVPTADAVFGDLRRKYDHSSAWGIPAHVTVLYPFVAPFDVDEVVIATLAETVACVSAFACHFNRTQRFDKNVLWLDPEPNDPFRLLTTALWSAFPLHPPYGGVHEDVLPHLTLAEARLTDQASMDRAEEEAQRRLPLSSHIDHLLLIAGTESPDSWRVLQSVPLGK